MTFYEAALRILESEGHPLHFLEITEKSVAQNLLSHVGKMPEQTMLSRLAAMAKRTRDRRVIVTAKDTFALTDWGLPEDAEALALTGIPETNEEEDLPPLRPVERHPESRADQARSAGRGDRERERPKRHRDDAEGRGGKRRRYPPVSEVAFEMLTEASEGLAPEALLEHAREKQLASAELSSEMLLSALLEDNQRRIDAGRRPQFAYGNSLLTLDRPGSSGVEVSPSELQAAFAVALGIPFEGGRPVLQSRSAPASAVPTDDLSELFVAAKTAVREARRASARSVRQKLAQVEVGTLERACVKMLHGLSFRELKVAKRSKDGPLLTARKKEGSLELRYVVRVCRATAPLDRRTIQDLRRDVGAFSAQVGLLLTPQDLRGDARGESQNAGPLVFLWCGDALGEKFLEAGAGVHSTHLEMFELDPTFFEEARRDAEEVQRRRDERHRERDEAEPEGSAQASPAAPPGTSSTAPPRRHSSPPAEVAAAQSDAAQGSPDDEGDEGDEGEESEGSEGEAVAAGLGPDGKPIAATPGSGEVRRRRRRRRGRRGRGRRPDGTVDGILGGTPGGSPGQGATGGAPDAQASGTPAAPSGSEGSQDSAPPPPPPGEPSGGESGERSGE